MGQFVVSGWSPDVQPGEVTYVTVEDREAAVAAADSAELAKIAAETSVTDAEAARDSALEAQTAAEEARDVALAATDVLTAPADDVVASFIADPDSSSGIEVRDVTISQTIRLRPVVTNTAPQGARREYPQLSLPMDEPILNKTDTGQTLNSIYWPWLVDRWQGNPSTPAGERYALAFSTDHAVEPAPRIGWATAATPTGPWTARGMLYKDEVAGSQTETPSIIWDEATSKWLMFYQQKAVGVGDQSTMLATSPDFTTWTRVGIVAEQEVAFPGVGHMGYFRPFRWGGRWYAYSLAGQGYMTMWYSDDGYVWERDARISPNRPDLIQHLPGYVESDQWIVKWTNSTVLNWNGSPWIVMVAGAYAPGGEEVQDKLIAAPLSPDFRTLLSRPVNITPALQEWQTITQGLGGFVTTDDGRIFGVQRANGASTGSFFLLEVV